MSKSEEKILLLITDLLAVNLAFVLVALGREVGLQAGVEWFGGFPVRLNGVLAASLSIYWLFFFPVFGLYKSWYNQSRVDELFQILKVSFFGMGVLCIVTLNLKGPFLLSSLLLTVYWLLLFSFVCAGRLGIRSFQRHLLLKGIGRRNTLIVGGGATGGDLLKKIRAYPALGYEVIGFVDRGLGAEQKELDGVPYLGSYEDLPCLAATLKVSDIIIAVESGSHEEIMSIIDNCKYVRYI